MWVLRDDWTAMAVSLSTNAVKLYSPVTGQYYGECKGHSATINQISFADPSSPHVLHSCSSDGTIRLWDSRTFQQVRFSIRICIEQLTSRHVFLVLIFLCCRCHLFTLVRVRRFSAFRLVDHLIIFWPQDVILRY